MLFYTNSHVIFDIVEERNRQAKEKGYDAAHDRQHSPDELARAAACYALPDALRDYDAHAHFTGVPREWPFADGWNPAPDNRRRELVKAAALLVAAIDRLDRDRVETQALRYPHV